MVYCLVESSAFSYLGEVPCCPFVEISVTKVKNVSCEGTRTNALEDLIEFFLFEFTGSASFYFCAK